MRGPCPLFPAGVVQPPVDRRADQRRILRDEIERDAAIPGPRNGIASGFAQRRDCGGMAFKRGDVQRGAAFALNPASVLPEEKVAPKTGGFDSTAFVHRIEGVAFLILSGKFIGYLPVHYAAGWVDAGCMRSILPGGCKPKSKSRRGPVLSPIAHFFLEMPLLTNFPPSFRGRSASAGFRWCPRRSRTAWRRAAGGRSDSR